jgi:hypothetical protein
VTSPEVPATAVAPSSPHGPARSRWFRAGAEVVWLILLAAAVRALAAWTSPTILNDGVRLLETAARVRDGASAALAGPDHPLTPWLIALCPSGWDLERFATALCVFAGALAVWPLHVLVRTASGRHAATAACIVYAALPKAVGVAGSPMTSAVFLPLFLSGISLAVVSAAPVTRPLEAPRHRLPHWWRAWTMPLFQYRRRHRGRVRRTIRLLGAGVLCGLAYLCRPEGLVAAAGALLVAFFIARPGRRLVAAAFVALAFVVVAAPYATALSRDAGRLVLSPKKDVVVFVGAADTASPARDAGQAFADAGNDLQAALTAPIFILVLVGIFSPRRWRDRRSRIPRIWLLLTAGAFLAAVVRLRTGWGYGGARHALPAAMLLLPFAGEGLLFVGSFISKVVARRRLAVVLASYYAIPCAVNAVMRPEGADLAEARRLGEAVAEDAKARGRKEVVIATFGKPLVAYYADKVLRPDGGRATDLRLWRDFRGLLEHPEAADRRAELAKRLRDERASFLVLDLFRATKTPAGGAEIRGRELERLLAEDGAVGGRPVCPGGALAAFPVK